MQDRNSQVAALPAEVPIREDFSTLRDPELRQLVELAHDKSVDGRSALVASVSDLYFGEHRVLTDEGRELITAIIWQLVHDIEVSGRRPLSERFAGHPGAKLGMVGLSGFENHYPKSLSGGMKMRASLARTLTLRPPVFMFDEPFGAVDEITREHLNDETQALFQHEGFAGLFITHSIGEAVFMSTRVLVMSSRPGRIVAEFEVPFDYPRVPDLRFDPDFAILSGEVSHALRGGHS